MKKVLALVVAAAGLSSAAFAADAVSTTQAPAATQHGCQDHPSQKHHKAAAKPAAEQKAQAAKKTQKAELKPAATQKAQAAKTQKVAVKPVAPQKAQAAKSILQLRLNRQPRKRRQRKHHKTTKHQAA